VTIYRAVIARLNLEAEDEAQLFDILQRKSHPDLADFGRARGLNGVIETLGTLMDLNGDVSVLQRARSTLTQGDAQIAAALDTLQSVAASLASEFPQLPVHVDLAELRGSRYHTGLVFAAFVPGYGREIARGGRYDGVGREFGRALPATGFSADMNELLRLGAE
jgi:ATP phosphoribosyltransferase regulatory subunit